LFFDLWREWRVSFGRDLPTNEGLTGVFREEGRLAVVVGMLLNELPEK
jgi:hypothetical protein